MALLMRGLKVGPGDPEKKQRQRSTRLFMGQRRGVRLPSLQCGTSRSRLTNKSRHRAPSEPSPQRPAPPPPILALRKKGASIASFFPTKILRPYAYHGVVPPLYLAFHTPGNSPSLASFLNIILDSPVRESTARGLPVRTQRIRMRVADVLFGFSARARCAACRTDHGKRLDITMDFNTIRLGSASAKRRRRITSIITLPMVE